MDLDLWNAYDAGDLIDGSPDKVEEDARRLRRCAGRFEEIGDDLRRTRAEGWTGHAADTFESEMQRHPKHWCTAAAALENVAKALDTYAESLRQALKDADEAIRLVEKAKEIYKDNDWLQPVTQPLTCDGPEFTSWSELSLFHCEGYRKGGEDFIYHGDLFGIPLDATGHGTAGLDGNADASIGHDGAHIGVNGMIGATYEVDNTFTVAGQDVTLQGNGHLGPGLTADATLGQDDKGHWQLGVKGGLSLLVGGGVGLTVPVPDPAVEALNDGLDEAGHLGHEAWEHMPWN